MNPRMLHTCSMELESHFVSSRTMKKKVVIDRKSNERSGARTSKKGKKKQMQSNVICFHISTKFVHDVYIHFNMNATLTSKSNK